jgi:hypothetical protein
MTRQIAGRSWRGYARPVAPTRRSEATHGADLAIFVDIDFAEDDLASAYKTTKTMLVQVKRADRLSRERTNLYTQVAAMDAFCSSTAVLIVGGDGSSRSMAATFRCPMPRRSRRRLHGRSSTCSQRC